jgi:hypothetical protein
VALGADLADQAEKPGFGHAPLYSSRPISPQRVIAQRFLWP